KISIFDPKICTINNEQKLAVFDANDDTAASEISLCYYLDKNGRLNEVGVGEYLKQIHGTEFVSSVREYDMASDGSGASDKPYYLHWNGTGFEEYKGKEISLRQLKKYNGAKSFVKKIQKKTL
ncbi:MAG: hypothetical protein IKQ97_09540, partial [Eubacterium sp.]|nr:hypothetical protein [Eubacterium sp.]